MTAAASAVEIPVVYRRLRNGLRVVLSEDHAAPIVALAVYYHVGMRLEPRGRTGFAHLFEHLMFQGSQQLEKMELVRLVQQNGGTLNGSTRLDFTNYYEVVPKHALDLMLWAEADRMRGPLIAQAELDNQREVVKNEVRVNVLNRPYGGFPWLDLSEHAFTNWHNSHNGYGDMVDLNAATLEDAHDFFQRYYSPANAVVVLVGDIDPGAAFEAVARYFEDIPVRGIAAAADISEPRQEAERRVTRTDRLATRPALAFGYHTPRRDQPEFFAMGMLDQLLLQGDDSLLHRELVRRRGITAEVMGGMNFLGSMYGATTPLLWHGWLIHDADRAPDEALAAVDAALAPILAGHIESAWIERARVKARSGLYEMLGGARYPGVGRADLLASFALLDDDPARINSVDEIYAAVTPAQLVATAREYLIPANRTVVALEAGVAP